MVRDHAMAMRATAPWQSYFAVPSCRAFPTREIDVLHARRRQEKVSMGARRLLLALARWVLLPSDASAQIIVAPPIKVPQVSIKLLAKSAESCDAAFSGCE